MVESSLGSGVGLGSGGMELLRSGGRAWTKILDEGGMKERLDWGSGRENGMVGSCDRVVVCVLQA